MDISTKAGLEDFLELQLSDAEYRYVAMAYKDIIDLLIHFPKDSEEVQIVRSAIMDVCTKTSAFTKPPEGPVSSGMFDTLKTQLKEGGLETDVEFAVREKTYYSDEELFAELSAILQPIKTLKDYESLVDIILELENQITLRFVAIFFKGLVDVEERVWANSGYPLNIRPIFASLEDCLIDNFGTFLYEYEKSIIDITKEKGWFDTQDGYAFICKRNEIYAKYVVMAARKVDPAFATPINPIKE